MDNHDEITRLLADGNRLQLQIVKRLNAIEARLVKVEAAVKRSKVWWRIAQVAGAILVFIITFQFGDISKLWR